MANQSAEHTYKKQVTDHSEGFYPFAKSFIEQSDILIIGQMAEYLAEKEFLLNFKNEMINITTGKQPSITPFLNHNILGAANSESSIHDEIASKYLNLETACKYLNISKPTMYGYTSRKEIPFIKRMKKLIFKKEDLDQWLESGRKITREEKEKLWDEEVSGNN